MCKHLFLTLICTSLLSLHVLWVEVVLVTQQKYLLGRSQKGWPDLRVPHWVAKGRVVMCQICFFHICTVVLKLAKKADPACETKPQGEASVSSVWPNHTDRWICRNRCKNHGDHKVNWCIHGGFSLFIGRDLYYSIVYPLIYWCGNFYFVLFISSRHKRYFNCKKTCLRRIF